MIDPAVFIREPLIFQNKIKIYPPSVREVVANPEFNLFFRILTLTQEEIQKEVGPKLGIGEKLPTPFEYLILNCQYVQGFEPLVRMALLYFCKAQIEFNFEDQIISLSGEGWQDEIREENFFEFQNKIRVVSGYKEIKPPEPIDPDEDPRITEIKRRARERDRIKAKQGNKNGLSLSTCLIAICCMGIGITPLNIGELSYASIGPIMDMMQEKEKYDIDIRSLLAGADSKKIKPKYWIRNKE